MLEDRDYMREPGFRSGNMSMTKLLTIVLAVVFALQCINDVYLKTGVERWLALTYEGVTHGWVWQLITFQFLHFNLMHVAFNLLTFWFFGHFVENVLGQEKISDSTLRLWRHWRHFAGNLDGLVAGTLWT